MIDTATLYGTEEGVGTGVKRAMDEGLVAREDLFIMTKIPPYDQSIDKVSSQVSYAATVVTCRKGNQFNNIRVFQTVDMITKSLKILQLDYLDCVLIHFPGRRAEDAKAENKSVFFSSLTSDPERAPEARVVMWEGLQKCQQDGKIRHIGVSNFNRDHIQKLTQDPRKERAHKMFPPFACK